MKIMFLVPSGTQRSDARFRVFPFVELVRDKGVDISWEEVPASFMDRYTFFSRLPHADTYVVHRELLSALELQAVRRLCSHLIYDFSDAVWTLPMSEFGRFGGSVGISKIIRRFERLCREVDICVVDNRSQAERIAPLQEQIQIVSTGVDTDLYTPGTGGNFGGPTLVGWMGNNMEQAELSKVLKPLAECEGAYQFSIVSHSPYDGPGMERAFWSAWSASKEAEQLQAMDIGLVPLADDEYSRACSCLEVLRYMASGVAVVSSDIGHGAKMIDHGIDGFLVRDKDDWSRHVLRLIEDVSLRQNMIEAARQKVCAKYSLGTFEPKMLSALGF